MCISWHLPARRHAGGLYEVQPVEAPPERLSICEIKYEWCDMCTVSVMTAAFEKSANAGVVKRVEWKERQLIYVPKAYRADQPRKIVKAYPFATLA
ncbi:MAG: hypothetical protein AAGB16_08375, partial [Pseudomonadota bacterium]